MSALAEAIARLDVRFGARTVVAAGAAEDVARQKCFLTDTSFDLVSGGIRTGSVIAFSGEGSSGKVTLVLRAVAGAQQSGGMALWVDPTRSFDPAAAARAGVDVRRTIVVRARTRDEAVLTVSAGLRSEGFRIVVADLGPSFAAVVSADALAPALPSARGSLSALVILSDEPPRRLAIPTFAFEPTDAERAHGRTLGWAFEVRRVGAVRDERALFAVGLDGRLADRGCRAELREEAV
ncbi:MAG: hypothetical protein KGN00_13385 [Chloroflexota bacterium]|nr:hypothetical protein [Chloroflexota bacterium]MDE3194661.1 hypothetical protein [Chloroflexota bacterium]